MKWDPDEHVWPLAPLPPASSGTQMTKGPDPIHACLHPHVGQVGSSPGHLGYFNNPSGVFSSNLLVKATFSSPFRCYSLKFFFFTCLVTSPSRFLPVSTP